MKLGAILVFGVGSSVSFMATDEEKGNLVRESSERGCIRNGERQLFGNGLLTKNDLLLKSR